MNTQPFANPFRPGAGHYPPYLAGREREREEFLRLLEQERILENLVLTGLRGVGKTVLLEKFKPLAQERGWLWTGTDISESVSVSEDNLATRILTDLSILTSNRTVEAGEKPGFGFTGRVADLHQPLDYNFLLNMYNRTPGLALDKLKGVLEYVWSLVKDTGIPGIIFAYDEAQNIADNAGKEHYPLGVLLDTFQSLQRRDVPFMLALAGLPTLVPKLVDARTYAERMFRVLTLDRLSESETLDAIMKPIQTAECPITFDKPSIALIWQVSDGYPYFVQFYCREVFDVWVADQKTGQRSSVPVDAITRKLDSDFFIGRWSRATDRQRDLLIVIAQLDNSSSEFTVQEIVEFSRSVQAKGFGSSHCNQMLANLITAGLVYKNRHGKYSLSVPQLDKFILRQINEGRR